MLACRRLTSKSSLRRYASASSSSPATAKKVAAPTPPPAPPPSTFQPKTSNLKHRLIAASTRDAHARQAATAKRLAPPDAKSAPGLSDEERQMAHVRNMLDYRESMKRTGMVLPPIELPLLDHAIPYAVRFRARAEYPSWGAMWDQFRKNRVNDGKNAFAMYHIGVSNAFPGVTIDQNRNWFSSTYLFMRRVFGAQSLKAASWVAPMRQEMLEQYIKLNTALAQDPDRLPALTMEPFRGETAALARAQKAARKPGQRALWSFHREVSATRILSLRAADGAFEKEMPATGTRVAVQALVRFDTEQSVELYAKDGTPLHTPAPTATLPASPAPSPSPSPSPTASPAASPAAATRPGKQQQPLVRVPAERRRVVEFLVLDKAMYEAGAEWRFRARYVPEGGRTVSV